MHAKVIFLVLIVPIAGVVLHVLLARWLDRRGRARRVDAWHQVGQVRGWGSFGRDNDLLDRFGHFSLLQEGQFLHSEGGIRDKAGGTEITVADIREAASEAPDVWFTVCIVHRRDLRLPACVLRPTSAIDALGGLFYRTRAIRFANDPGFHSNYVLLGVDERATRRLFNAETREWFLGRGRAGSLRVETQADAFLFSRGKLARPEEAEDLLGEAREILELLSGSGGGGAR